MGKPQKPSRKDAIQKIEKTQSLHREEIQAKREEKRAVRSARVTASKEAAKQSVIEEELRNKNRARKTEEYKKKQQESAKEYDAFRKKKDKEEKKLLDEKKKRAVQREEYLAYLKEMSTTNRKNIAKAQRDRDATEEKEAARSEADRDAKRIKLDADTAEREAVHALERDSLKERGKTDIYENHHTDNAREEARSAQVKLKVKERTELDRLDGQISRERAQAQAMFAGQKQIALSKVADTERNERQKIEKKYIKLSHDIEVEANQKIARIKKESKKMRDDVSNKEKNMKLALHHQKMMTRMQADKDAANKRSAADKKEKDILTNLAPEEDTEEEGKGLL